MQVQRQYALKQIFMKIKFENSIRRLSILYPLPDIKIAWLNPCAPTRVEFLFRVLLGIGALFRLVTPHSSVPLCITSRSCEGETQKHGSTCLLRITMSFNFYLVLRVWLSVTGLNYAEYQKISSQYKYFL